MFSTPPSLCPDIPGPSLGECARLLLTLGGQEWTEVRYPIDAAGGTWAKPEFDAAQAAGTFPMLHIPMLEAHGAKISQSKAIERYLAREAGLFGANSLEAAQIDQIGEVVVDIQTAFGKLRFAPADDEGVKGFFGGVLPEYLGSIERCVVEGAINLADVQLFNLLSAISIKHGASVQACLAAAPKVAARHALVAANEKIAAYLAKRPACIF